MYRWIRQPIVLTMLRRSPEKARGGTEKAVNLSGQSHYFVPETKVYGQIGAHPPVVLGVASDDIVSYPSLDSSRRARKCEEERIIGQKVLQTVVWTIENESPVDSRAWLLIALHALEGHTEFQIVIALRKHNIVISLYGVQGMSETGKAAKPSRTRNASDDEERRSLSGNRPQIRIRSGGINGLERLAYLSLGPIKAEPGDIYDGRTEYVSLREADHLSPSEYLIDYIVKHIGNSLRGCVKEVRAIEAVIGRELMVHFYREIILCADFKSRREKHARIAIGH